MKTKLLLGLGATVTTMYGLTHNKSKKSRNNNSRAITLQFKDQYGQNKTQTFTPEQLDDIDSGKRIEINDHIFFKSSKDQSLIGLTNIPSSEPEIFINRHGDKGRIIFTKEQLKKVNNQERILLFNHYFLRSNVDGSLIALVNCNNLRKLLSNKVEMIDQYEKKTFIYLTKNQINFLLLGNYMVFKSVEFEHEYVLKIDFTPRNEKFLRGYKLLPTMVKLLHLGQTIIIGDTAFKLLKKGKSSVIAAARTTSLLSGDSVKKSNVPRKRDTRYPSKPGYGYSSPPYYTGDSSLPSDTGTNQSSSTGVSFGLTFDFSNEETKKIDTTKITADLSILDGVENAITGAGDNTISGAGDDTNPEAELCELIEANNQKIEDAVNTGENLNADTFSLTYFSNQSNSSDSIMQ